MERDGGYKAFILCYRIRPNYYPLPQMDLARAVMYVRAHAAEYQVDPNRIVIVGASAGGHLCASEALLHEELKENVLENLAKFQKADMVEQYRKISARPDAVGLLYPVISFTSRT
ncbi:MAG: alpha/beta hydrolase [Roseburia intestinalis]